MEAARSRIQQLIDRPGESLAVEIKTWIDPDSSEGQSKIVRAVLALRNHGGGYLLIGFNNGTLMPDATTMVSAEVRALFHIDKIQGLVTRFASESFEVAVEFGERDDRLFPVLVVPSGVRTPVAAKSDLSADCKKLIAADDVYVRTLHTNHTPSTAKAGWKDWARLVEVCFDNREADIGRFMRRHFGNAAPLALHQLAAVLGAEMAPHRSTEEHLLAMLNDGEQRFQQLIKERSLTLPVVGWWDVALLIDGDVPSHAATKDFLNLLDASNPDLTGWPIWLDSRGFNDKLTRPFVTDGHWEALIVALDDWSRHIDFMQLDPKGRFFLRWALQDDITSSQDAPSPGTVFDFGLPVMRCVEAIAVGLAFAKAMGCDQEQCTLQFAFRWSGLQGRELSSWAQPSRYVSPGRHAYQNQVTVFQRVPLNTPLSAIGGLLATTLKPLYEVFEGFELSPTVAEELSAWLVERRR